MSRSDAEKVTLTSDENLALADSRRGKRFLAEIVFRNEIKLWPGFDNVHLPFVVEEVNIVFGRNERCVMFPETLLPKDLARPGFEAVRHTTVRHHEKPITHRYWRRHVRDTPIRAPGDFGPGDISLTVRFDRQNVMVGKSTSHEEQVSLLIIHNRGDELLGRSIDDPMQFAICWIVTGDAFVSRQDHLCSSGQFTDERDTVAASMVFTWCFPGGAPVLAIECHDVGISVVIPVHDHKIFIEDG